MWQPLGTGGRLEGKGERVGQASKEGARQRDRLKEGKKGKEREGEKWEERVGEVIAVNILWLSNHSLS